MSLIGVRSIELGSTKAFPGPKRQMVASNLVIIPYKVANYRRFITIYCIITLTVSLSASEASYFLISQAFFTLFLQGNFPLIYLCVYCSVQGYSYRGWATLFCSPVVCITCALQIGVELVTWRVLIQSGRAKGSGFISSCRSFYFYILYSCIYTFRLHFELYTDVPIH